MELNILKEIDNRLFKRKEILATAEAKITPTYKEVTEFLSKKFSVELGKIKIKKISGKFGSRVFEIIVNIYDSEKDKNSVERRSKRDVQPEAPIEEKPLEENKLEEEKKE